MPVHIFDYSKSAEIPYIGEHPDISKIDDLVIRENVQQAIQKVNNLFTKTCPDLETQHTKNPKLKKAILTLDMHIAETMTGAQQARMDGNKLTYTAHSENRSAQYSIEPIIEEELQESMRDLVETTHLPTKSAAKLIPIAMITIADGEQKETYMACALQGRSILVLTDEYKGMS